jgi:hypothetical protein
MKKPNNFDKILLEAIDEGLSVLGDGGKHMVFFYLEKNCSIRKQDIPENPEAFIRGLEKIFGAGTTVLEKMILKCICSKLGLKYDEREERRLIDCLKEANLVLTRISEEPEKQDEDSGLAPTEAAEGYQAKDESPSSVENEDLTPFKNLASSSSSVDPACNVMV